MKSQLVDYTSHNEMYKTVIGTKEQKIVDLEAKVTQTQTTISTVL